MPASEAEVDEIGRRTVLDLVDDEGAEGLDITPGVDIGEDGDRGRTERCSGERHEQRRLLEMAREAEALARRAGRQAAARRSPS